MPSGSRSMAPASERGVRLLELEGSRNSLGFKTEQRDEGRVGRDYCCACSVFSRKKQSETQQGLRRVFLKERNSAGPTARARSCGYGPWANLHTIGATGSGTRTTRHATRWWYGARRHADDDGKARDFYGGMALGGDELVGGESVDGQALAVGRQPARRPSSVERLSAGGAHRSGNSRRRARGA